jgi:hypothetical protein
MRKILLAAILFVIPAACTKTGENEYQVKTPTVGTETKTVTTPDVDISSKKDTINTPVVGTQKETLIVNKPVVGTKKTEVTTPTVKVTKP